MPPLLLLLLEHNRRDSIERVLRYFRIEPDEHMLSDRTIAFHRLRAHLLRVRAADVQRLGSDAGELVRVLRECASAPTRDRVLARWSSIELTDIPEFAEGLLAAFGEDLHQHAVLRNKVAASLLPIALRDAARIDGSAPSLRRLLMRHFADLVSANPAISAACAEDRIRVAREQEERERERLQREEEDRARAAQREAARQARLDEISAMPLLQRVELLLAGGVGVEGPYPLEWARVPEVEVASLSNDVRRGLIRTLCFRRNEVYRELRRRLLAPDRLAKEKQRTELEALLRDKPVHLQLEHLASSTLPVGMYPVWLPARALEELPTLSPALKSLILRRLAGQRRGRWRSLLEALGEERNRLTQDAHDVC